MEPFEKGDVLHVSFPGGASARFKHTVERITEPKRSHLTPRKGQVVQRLHLTGRCKIDVLVKAA